MAKKTTRKPKTNPYIKHFLHQHTTWSAAMARAGEESWDAALDTAITKVTRISMSFCGPKILRALKALKSTNQRG
jgi:hypothetical protein